MVLMLRLMLMLMLLWKTISFKGLPITTIKNGWVLRDGGCCYGMKDTVSVFYFETLFLERAVVAWDYCDMSRFNGAKARMGVSPCSRVT